VSAGLPIWALRFSAKRARGEWRLLAVITAVALIACTLITSLSVLVAATEQGGLRAELSRATDNSLDITMFNVTADVDEVVDAATGAMATLVGPSASATFESSVAESNIFEAPPLTTLTKKALGYVGEYSGIRDHTALVSGEWPTEPGDIALPDSAATGFGLALGDSVTLDVLDEAVTATIVATYASDDSEFWDADTLQGAGFDPQFPLPESRVFVPTNGFGPILYAPGGMDAADIPVERIDLSFLPDFSRFDVADLPGFVERLDPNNRDVASQLGDVGSLVVFFSDIDSTADAAASGLVVTRSTVVVTSLLLLVLAVAALAQSARLLVDAREAERRLMVSRGANRRQVLLLALIEALGIGVLTAMLSPVLASLVYAALAAQPTMSAAGMPSWQPPTQFALAAVVALLFVVILIAPMFRRAQSETRERRITGVMSSGLDLGLVAIAAVAYWQLSSYRSPVREGTDLAIDPLLVAGPAIVLVAGALLAVRFIPLVARLFERLASRSVGTLVPLAAWEVARRAQRSIAAVLLLTLALAVATFSLSFLSTWRQSQVDQADIAIGTSVRVPSVQGSLAAQGVLLGDAQPTTHRQVNVAGPGADLLGDAPPSGSEAIVLGLTEVSRTALGEGRMGREGGSALEPVLDPSLTPSNGIDLAPDARGISATVRVEGQRLDGAAIDVRAVLEDATGLLSILDLGAVPVDGETATVSAEFDPGAASVPRIVGFQLETVVEDPDNFQRNNPSLSMDIAESVVLSDIASLVGDDLDPQPVDVDPGIRWNGRSVNALTLDPEVVAPTGAEQLRVDLTVASSIDLRPLAFAVVGWTPLATIPAVITDDLAETMNVAEGQRSYLVIGGSTVPVVIEDTTPLIPGSGVGTALSSAAPSNFGAIAVDENGLFRSLVQAGVVDLPLDEWWIDVPAGQAQQYLDSHADVPGVTDAASRELLARDLQEGPLRIGTQAALWLAIAAAALLAAIGFAVHTAATLSSRSAELAQLRAIGFSRWSIVRLIGVESALLAALGTVFGIAIGVLLGYLTGPLIAVSPTGLPTVPGTIVIIPWLSIVLLLVELAAVLAVVIATVARTQRSSDPASILRAGG